eukprot:TRINITY_DN27563_c0_g1_i1.p1 TRINITY_DN27563_c0_g1~~TRINITY_DN27563_c0_g1_i1.p1  ORF type:complete len:1410 (+),score=245.82 TRINITY_DN27563_c0_g1_i1:105-4334(+)
MSMGRAESRVVGASLWSDYAYDRDAFPSALPWECVLLVALVVGLCFLALVVQIARGCAGREPRAATLLFYALCLTFLLVGSLVWHWTYTTMRGVVLDGVEHTLFVSGQLAKAHFEGQLGIGAQAVHLVQADVKAGRVDLAAPWPQGQAYLGGVLHALAAGTPLITRLSYSTQGNGDMLADGGPSTVGLVPVAPAQHLWMAEYTPDFRGTPVEFVVCNATDRGECAGYACGSTRDGDFKCQATCAGRPVVLRYDREEGAGGTVVLPSAHPRFCHFYPNGTALRTSNEFLVEFNPVGAAEFRPVRPTPDALAAVASFLGEPGAALPGLGGNATHATYPPWRRDVSDPRSQPWWQLSPTPRWLAPQHDAFRAAVGVTLTAGLHDRAGVFQGCLRVDFALAVFSDLLRELKPTSHSVLFQADVAGYLVGTSWSRRELLADTGAAQQDVIYVHNVRNRAASITHRTFAKLAGRHGTLAAAHRRRIQFHDSADFIMSMPVEAPFSGKFLCVMRTPWADVMGAPDRASLHSLATALGVSVVVAAVIVGLLAGMVLGLQQLGKHMVQLGRMEVDLVLEEMGTEEGFQRSKLSKYKEVVALQQALYRMAVELKAYRSFLPAQILTHSAAAPPRLAAAVVSLTPLHTAADAGAIRMVSTTARDFEGKPALLDGADAMVVCFESAENACVFALVLLATAAEAHGPSSACRVCIADCSADGCGARETAVAAAKLLHVCPTGAACVTPEVLRQVDVAALAGVVVPVGAATLLIPAKLHKQGVPAVPKPDAAQHVAGRLEKFDWRFCAADESGAAEAADTRNGVAAAIGNSLTAFGRLCDGHLQRKKQVVGKTAFDQVAETSLDSCTAGLAEVHTAVGSTSGSVLSVLGSAVVVSWTQESGLGNTKRAVAYVRALRPLDGSPDAMVTTGLASGVMVTGVVGAATAQRFVTSTGPATALLDPLLKACATLGTGALYAAWTEGRDAAAAVPSIRRAMRPVDVCTMAGKGISTAGVVRIYEVRTSRSPPGHAGEAPAAWSEEYWRAHAASDAAWFAEHAGADPVVAAVWGLLKQGYHVLDLPALDCSSPTQTSQHRRRSSGPEGAARVAVVKMGTRVERLITSAQRRGSGPGALPAVPEIVAGSPRVRPAAPVSEGVASPMTPSLHPSAASDGRRSGLPRTPTEEGRLEPAVDYSASRGSGRAVAGSVPRAESVATPMSVGSARWLARTGDAEEPESDAGPTREVPVVKIQKALEVIADSVYQGGAMIVQDAARVASSRVAATPPRSALPLSQGPGSLTPVASPITPRRLDLLFADEEDMPVDLDATSFTATTEASVEDCDGYPADISALNAWHRHHSRPDHPPPAPPLQTPVRWPHPGDDPYSKGSASVHVDPASGARGTSFTWGQYLRNVWPLSWVSPGGPASD